MLNMLPSATKMRADIHEGQEKFKQLLRHYHLRPTKQRLIIAAHLFKQSKRHIHADMLHEEIAASGEIISVATIYNSLRHFCNAGLIRAVASRGTRQWFCTDICNECQCYFDDGEHIEILENFSPSLKQFAQRLKPALRQDRQHDKALEQGGDAEIAGDILANSSDQGTSLFDWPTLPDIPPGYEIAHIDISIHLEKIPTMRPRRER